MAKVTIADLQEKKRRREYIVASVCHDYQMAQILDRAGADILSVGDSVGHRFLGYDDPDAITLDEILPFCKGVSRAAKHALVSCDMPVSCLRGGPQAVVDAAKRLVNEGGAELVKVDIREDMDGLFPVIEAAAKAGINIYPHTGFPAMEGGRRSGEEVRQILLRTAKRVEEAGAVMIDLTNVAADIYADVVKSVRIPVIGGHNTGPEADGKIYTSYAIVGYDAGALDRADNGRANVAKTIFEVAQQHFVNVRAGNFS